MSEKPQGQEGRSGAPAGSFLVGVMVLYAIVLAVATVSEVFDLGWFDWMILSR